MNPFEVMQAVLLLALILCWMAVVLGGVVLVSRGFRRDAKRQNEREQELLVQTMSGTYWRAGRCVPDSIMERVA